MDKARKLNLSIKHQLNSKFSIQLTTYMPQILTSYEKFIGREQELEKIEQGYREFMPNLILATKEKIMILTLACSFICYKEDSLANTVTIEGNTKIKDSQINTEEYQGNVYEEYKLVPTVSMQFTSYLPQTLTNYEKFVNRSKELAIIEKAFASNQIVVITGPGGIGKSSLSIEYAKHYKGDNRIVRHFNADTISKVDQAYRELAQELDINLAEQPFSIIMRLVHNKITMLPQEILFILDNVEQYDCIKDYVTNIPANVKVLITTRQPKLIAGVPHILLEEFDDEAAREYLEYSLQNRSLNKQDMQELINNASTLPYDLKCTSAYLIDNPLIDSKKAILESGGKIKGKLFEEFITSPDKIKQQAWQILQYAAHLDPDFISMTIIRELFPQKAEQAGKAIKKLESLSLISIITNSNSQIGFRIHRKLQKSILYSVKNHPKYSLNNKHLIADLLNVLDGLFSEVDRSPDIKWQIASSLQPHVKKILEQEFKLLDYKARINQANLYYKLSVYHFRVSVNFKQAMKYAEISLEQRRNLYKGDHSKLASSLNLIGNIYRECGNGQESLKYLKQGLEIRLKLYLADHVDVADSLFNIGGAYRELGETQKSLKYTQKALEMNQRLHHNNHIDIIKSLNLMGLGYLNSGDFEKSLSYFQRSLQLLKSLYEGNHDMIASLLNNIAYNYHKLGNYTESLKYAILSLDMGKELYINDNPLKIYSLRSYGAALIELNKLEDGLAALHEALEISERLGVDKHFLTAFINYNLGIGYFKSKNYQKSLEHAEKALSLRQEIYATAKNHIEIADSLHSLGDIHFASGDKIKALESYKQALEMSLALSLDHLPETKEIQKKIKELKR